MAAFPSLSVCPCMFLHGSRKRGKKYQNNELLKQRPYKEIYKHEVLHSNRDLMLFPMKQREIHLKMCLRYLPQLLLKWRNLLSMNKNTLFEECPRDSNMNVNSISSLAYKENLLQLKGNQLLLYPKRKLCFYLQLCTECLSMHLQHIAGPYLSLKNYQNPCENCQNTSFKNDIMSKRSI